MNTFAGNQRITIDDEVNALCASVATEILGSRDLINQHLVDKKLADFTRKAVKESVQNGFRRGTLGSHCFFCGAKDCGVTRCDCGFGESFGCGIAGRFICDGCKAAHTRIARHLREMFAAPKIMRSNCRKFLFERELHRAACAVASPTGDAGDYEPTGNERELAFLLAQTSAEDESPDEFRHGVLDAFRRARFLDFKGLDRALRRQKDETLLRSLTRTIRKALRAQGNAL